MLSNGVCIYALEWKSIGLERPLVRGVTATARKCVCPETSAIGAKGVEDYSEWHVPGVLLSHLTFQTLQESVVVL